ncbi:hypothetical protein JMN32_16720 [Fulvivirga sp. 29W222]|uniref:CBU-0592-like domain-containing protein n=1 Tax=Fulvivirga marina TaxID=2494733 RepID=A0A937KCW5_9BACT|nr:hypothetical protein [Fulvivirga marina]MBL6447962.1 hypothetical protein [Fulvivirga marina]
MSEYLFDALGWTGSVFIIAGYWLNSQGKLNPQGLPYQLINVVGGLLLLINTMYYSAYPSSAVNVIWLFVGGYHLFKIFTTKNTTWIRNSLNLEQNRLKKQR